MLENGFIDQDVNGIVLKTASATVLGGTISEIGGGKFANGAITGAYNYLFNKLLHGKAKWDKNGDGKLQKNEADDWFMTGTGDITVNGNSIDLTGLSAKDMTYDPDDDIYSLSTTKAFEVLPYETAATYGGSCFKLVGGKWQMLSQKYHYEIRPFNSLENIKRNVLTFIGRPSSMGITPSQFNQLGGQMSRNGAAYNINIKY